MLPVIHGIIDRRMLVNYRVEPAVLSKIVPEPFRPKLVDGLAIAGICLIRLKEIRPRGLPPFFGLGSENAAHRIAVEWFEDGVLCEGVYIPRRDTSSRLNAFLGGRLFPGRHHHAAFRVRETGERFELQMKSDDGEAQLVVRASLAEALPATSIFGTIERASKFFERGALGYSATPNANRFDGLELRTHNWTVEALTVEHVSSSFFENRQVFSAGSTRFDCALLMRNVRHEWHSRQPLCYC